MARTTKNKGDEGSRFDLAGMERAVREFLEASGNRVEGTELESTPSLVARAWRESFLDGYAVEPASLFEDVYPAEDDAGMVLLKAIPFHGMCPHHLLPFRGSAHVAYLPAAKLAALSSIPKLVDCFAHRLEIQETVTRQIAEALDRHLGTDGSAVVLDTDQACMTMRNAERKGTRTVSRHFTGRFAHSSELRLEFLKSLETFD